MFAICYVLSNSFTSVFPPKSGRGIRGTQVEPYIQFIVDEVVPIKEAPYGVEGRFIQM